MVETIRLESGHTLTGIGGSNPSLSAIHSQSGTRLNPLTRCPDLTHHMEHNQSGNLQSVKLVTR